MIEFGPAMTKRGMSYIWASKSQPCWWQWISWRWYNYQVWKGWGRRNYCLKC